MGAAGVEMGLRGKGRVPWVTDRTMHMGHSCPPHHGGTESGPPRHSAMQSCHGNRWGSFSSSCSLKVRRKKTGWGDKGDAGWGGPHTSVPWGGPQNAAVTALPAAMHRPDPPVMGTSLSQRCSWGGPHAPQVGVGTQQPWGWRGPPAPHQRGLIVPWGRVWHRDGDTAVSWGAVGGWELWFPPSSPRSACQAALPWQRGLTRATSPASPHRQPH